MHEYRAKSGKLIYYATRHELEALPGYRGNDRKGRACCPLHDGDNPTALSIDWATGWASCWSCGDAWSIRVGDPPREPGALTIRGKPVGTPKPGPTTPKRPRDRNAGAPDRDTLRETLTTAVAAAVERLPGSPGETYLAGRGIPLDVAQALGIGWAMTGALAGRVVFPLCGPDGRPTSATGRAPNDHTRPKYKALASTNGYVKTLFNGGAIAQARRSGHPVVVVEGPLDAAACVAAGIPLAVALCGKAYAHPEHFAGVATVVLALDADDAGDEGRRRLWLDLVARGLDVLVLPASALDGAKDLGEYWQHHGAMPPQLAARAIGPHMRQAQARPKHHLSTPANDDPVVEDAGPSLPILEALQRRTAEATRYLAMTPDDLPDDLKAEAEALAVELAANVEDALHFWADLHQREHVLTAEDRVAAHYALSLAMRSWPSDPGDVI